MDPKVAMQWATVAVLCAVAFALVMTSVGWVVNEIIYWNRNKR